MQINNEARENIRANIRCRERICGERRHKSQPSYLSGDLAIVIKVVESESPLLPVIFLHRYSTLQLLINYQQ